MTAPDRDELTDDDFAEEGDADGADDSGQEEEGEGPAMGRQLKAPD